MSEHDDKPDDPTLEQLPVEVERELAQALKQAWNPDPLDPALNARLIDLALDDPLAEATEEEVAASERLREALEQGTAHPEADLARALSAATRPGSIDDDTAKTLADTATSGTQRSKSNVVYAVFGAAGAVAALAAALALVVRPADRGMQSAPAAAAAVPTDTAVSRSTGDLFDAKFEVGRASARIDRIAGARSRDLRQNRYAAWGLK